MSIPPEIDTPEIMIDRDVLERNIIRMAAAVQAKGLALRPHVKTHKLPQIAEMQLAAGAVGVTVATLGEAEVFAEHGARDIFIAYPLWVGPRQAERLRRLATKARVAVGVDSSTAAESMAESMGEAVKEIEVLLEVDSGHHRSGVSADSVVDLARAAVQSGLRVTGVFTFPGHSYGPGMPQKASEGEGAVLGQAAALLQEAGFEISHRSGGSTPSAAFANAATATELRPGVYVFGDAQQLELESCTSQDIALTVAATVVSRHDSTSHTPRRIVLDCGSKILGGDRPAWTTGFGRLLDHPHARITALSEHHATVTWPADATLPAVGERLRVVPNHVCVAINLVNDVSIISDGKIVDRWRVAARGKNN
ncbi:D-serine deaminase-like pyridoxal phosphate-dependent protein [Paenarthrobacter nicotinovorans]|jgi:D-serine deaminase-like pyridoxal phosphate-dependent protein|uniref:D-serine deaminase-like pyridoxal phosphate-dependent protein n=1 Tax=Paenarthrobacter nicotinovorans TaxID=29320 RepID=A0ABT9TRR5_PAENI|nr:D-TA family PLP-dependent enzyme [Paenarthrobacter nicotinovorans]MDQ0104375.1 D-serine deaminase-like pyridoxal phosphate-dependent protein [Paenarthrobacter nicotinovorans]GAT88261.1 alanine racemase [Paenarthrobacter nicotinovorans]